MSLRSETCLASYQALLAKAVNTGNILSVLLELTYRCNLDCYYRR